MQVNEFYSYGIKFYTMYNIAYILLLLWLFYIYYKYLYIQIL